jgi:hypothetical protein
MATISIVLRSDDDDRDRLDLVGQHLFTELRDEYGSAVRRQAAAEVPEGSKGAVDMTIALSSLVISIAASHEELSKLVRLVADRVAPWRGCEASIKVDEHVVSLSSTSEEAVQQVIKALEPAKGY